MNDHYTRIRKMRAENAVRAAQAEVDASAIQMRAYGRASSYGDLHQRNIALIEAMTERRDRIVAAKAVAPGARRNLAL
jgi:hypothetical protein